jgi:hypothetical protein
MDGPTPEERLELQTVNHPVRTVVLWALTGAAALFLTWYLTR